MKRIARSAPLLVVCAIAGSVTLVGGVYAAVKIDGRTVAVKSLPGNRLKPHSLAGNRIKNDSVTGKQVKESSLGQVPSAERAGHATSADSALTADNATHATSADNAKQAADAASANHASSADSALSAASAAHAIEADYAANAAQVGGHIAACPPATQAFAGECWESAPRSAASQPNAAQACTEAGGHLPDAPTLRSFAVTSGVTLDAGGEWSSSITMIVAPDTYNAATVSAAGAIEQSSQLSAKKFRCALPLLR